MDSQAMMMYGLKRLHKVFLEYAAAQGWDAKDYQLFVHPKMGSMNFHFLLLVRTLEGGDDTSAWMHVDKFLRKNLKDEPELYESTSVAIWTFDQIGEGGGYRIPRNYDEINKLLSVGIHYEPPVAPLYFGE